MSICFLDEQSMCRIVRINIISAVWICRPTPYNHKVRITLSPSYSTANWPVSANLLLNIYHWNRLRKHPI